MNREIIAIIVTYNGSKWIDKCFGSLINSTIPIKILAIDNASSDNTPNIIKDHFPQVEVIETMKNLGFGKANNIGLKRVLKERADYAFLLNQDAWIEPDTIEKLISISETDNEYGIISPIHLNGYGDMLDYAFESYLGRYSTKTFYSDLYFNKVKPVYEAQYANAAAWLIPRATIKKIGLFNPIFPHYGEDTDYIARLKYHKLKIVISPITRIYHDRIQHSNNTPLKNFKRIYIDDLNKLLNINSSLHFALRRWLSDKLTIIFNKILKLHFKLSFLNLISMFKSILHIPHLISIRKKSKMEGAFIEV
ncbi:glycosyltransferase family 2 protein [Plebeiibacterium sediminum]|uniref:Glycosyltransferase family 2 protein n=1 Tax=Plebeiibacterium sediminum TaxID=2992112 RepID=A0AAE3M939_9BACT|nr:glycosyltransferase family 2 protein [Plebeiobacterium sediminum]MCW3789192.1 glycosyltransferase family 2 protein [Plebeiobacterium sediminum]